MSVFLFTIRRRIDAIMRVQEHDQASLLNRSPDRVKRRIIETFAYTFCTHDQSLEVRKGRNLVDDFQQSTGGNGRDERE